MAFANSTKLYFLCFFGYDGRSSYQGYTKVAFLTSTDVRDNGLVLSDLLFELFFVFVSLVCFVLFVCLFVLSIFVCVCDFASLLVSFFKSL